MNPDELPIFDVEFALNQFSGNQALLIRIVEKFIQQNEAFSEQLASNLQKESSIETKRQIHTLKGVAANLGFKRLVATCHKIEPQASSSTQIEDFRNLLDAIEIALFESRNYCNSATSSAHH
ncbi:Hpt domain-containing protein [Paraglaciecola aquimarina]|uniref:Hpt domain-containing protein n=1 Tax=Paraglaciecola aquimarina TaxID=1235557 RepID=A0ABU3T028_9ALTE|nr:Hpt domain-containing protein [Paraglaciecola aquimarina]MDU0355616.1 Hpt domain-containing protein [Paraglaciecola aquimarina]